MGKKTRFREAQLMAILGSDPAPFETLISHLMSKPRPQAEAESIFNLLKHSNPIPLALKLAHLLSSSAHAEVRAMATILLREHLTQEHLTESLISGQEATATAQDALELLIVQSMLQVAEADRWQHLAIEFVITLAEAHGRAPGMMRKLPQSISRLFSILMKMLLDVEDDPAWHSADTKDKDHKDPGETSNYIFGHECLDRLAISLGGNTIVPVALAQLPAYLSAPEWQKPHAALIALAQIAEGCSKVMVKKKLEQVVNIVLDSFQHPHPRVRWAAINAISQLSTNLGPDFLVQFHQCVLPALAIAMDDIQNPRVQAHAASAVLNFCENCTPEIMTPYIDEIVYKLFLLLQNSKQMVEGVAKTGLASVAHSYQDYFQKHDGTMLHAKAMHCMSLFKMQTNFYDERFSCKRTKLEHKDLEHRESQSDVIVGDRKDDVEMFEEAPRRQQTEALEVAINEAPWRQEALAVAINEPPRRQQTEALEVAINEAPMRQQTEALEVSKNEAPRRQQTEALEVAINEEKERAELSRRVACHCDQFPPIKRFAKKLASNQALVVCASDLLKSLENKEGACSPDDAFQKFWKDEALKKELVDEYKNFCSIRRLISGHATEERVERHEARMNWVKGDPILGIEKEDDAHLMRKVLSLSILYWMDINLYNIVDLRQVPTEMPPLLEFDYGAKNEQDEEALREEIEKHMGNTYDQSAKEDAFRVIFAKQSSCKISRGCDGVRLQGIYCILSKSVSYMICSPSTPDNVPP